MPDYITPVMMTQVLILGCLFIGLIMQAMHHAQIRQTERRILANQAKILAAIPQPISMEDLIMQELGPGLPEQEIFDNITPPTDEEMLALLEDMNARRNPDDGNNQS